MVIMQVYKIDKFIEFVIDLVNEDQFFYESQVNSKYYFLHGGCYELYKIVKYFFPQVKCLMETNLNHCAIEYEGNIYDASGIREDKKNFTLATEEDIEYLNRSFGLHLNDLESPKIIDDIKECRIKGKLY